MSIVSVVLLIGCQPEEEKVVGTIDSSNVGTPTDTLTYNQRMILGKWWLETVNNSSMPYLTRVDEYLLNGECIRTTCTSFGDERDTNVSVGSYYVCGDTLFRQNGSQKEVCIITQIDEKTLICEYAAEGLGVGVFEYSRMD